MLFNSSEFLLAFLPIVLIVYYQLPHRGQNAFLLLASLVFYASWDWRFLCRCCSRHPSTSGSRGGSRRWPQPAGRRPTDAATS